MKGLGNYSIANENIQRVAKPHVNEVYRLRSKSIGGVNSHLVRSPSEALQQYDFQLMKKAFLGIQIGGF